MRSPVLTRWLGVGLASSLAVVTLVLAATDRLSLYINPSSNWFAIPMAVLVLIGAVASFLLPLGSEAEHDHDHDHTEHDASARPLIAGATATGAMAATGVVAAIMLLPPAALSADAVATRDVGAAPLFAGRDLVTLATRGDTSQFGVGDWASVFATAPNPEAFTGEAVTLTGFVRPGDGADAFDLTRLVITHCVIDAQVATVPVAADRLPAEGGWVTVAGTVVATSAGELRIQADEITSIAEPKDPYEY